MAEEENIVSEEEAETEILDAPKKVSRKKRSKKPAEAPPSRLNSDIQEIIDRQAGTYVKK